MLPVLQIGPFSAQTSGLILLAGLWLGLTLSERFARGSQREVEALGNLLFYSLLAALIGARLGYALRFPAAFVESPASLLSLNPGLLDAWFAGTAALVFGLIYGQRQGLKFWPTLDAITPALAALLLAIALGNLASGRAYGLPSDLLWAIELWGASRHPSQIYEALAAAAILLLTIQAARQADIRAGLVFVLFVALAAGARLFLDAFRGEGLLLPNGWRAAQVAAWLILGACLWGYGWLSQRDGE